MCVCHNYSMAAASISALGLIAAVGWSSWVVLGVVVLTVLGLIYGLKTRKGSGINEHPGPDPTDPVITEQSDPARAAGPDGVGGEKDSDSIIDRRGTR